MIHEKPYHNLNIYFLNNKDLTRFSSTGVARLFPVDAVNVARHVINEILGFTCKSYNKAFFLHYIMKKKKGEQDKSSWP